MEKWDVISEVSKWVSHWQQHDGSEDIVEVKISRHHENFRIDILQKVIRSGFIDLRDQSIRKSRVFAVEPSLDIALKTSVARSIDAKIDEGLCIQALSCAHAKAVDYIAEELGAEKSIPVCTVFEFRDDYPPDEVSVEVKISERLGKMRAEIIENTTLAGFVSRKKVVAIDGEVDALIQIGKLRASQAGIDDHLIDLALSEARSKIPNQDSQETAKS